MKANIMTFTLALHLAAGLSCSAVTEAQAADRLVVMSYNIHIAKGLDGKLDLERIAKVINDVDPDLVSLQEVDRNVARSGTVDQAAELARLTGRELAFGRAIDLGSGQYGVAVLSNLPILESSVTPLPGSEPRAALAVTVKPAFADQLVFVATHLDHRDEAARRASLAKIADLFADDPAQLAVLAGDINAEPQSQVLKDLKRDWAVAGERQELPTFRADKPTRQIDYVAQRPANAWRVLETYVVAEPLASDHRPIVAVLEPLR